MLTNLTAEELVEALKKNRDSVHPSQYRPPNLAHVLPYIENSHLVKEAMKETRVVDPVASSINTLATLEENDTESDSYHDNEKGKPESFVQEVAAATPGLVRDTRIMFIELLRAAYQHQVKDGELDPRESNGLLVHALFQTLDFAEDAVSRGEPLNDWDSWVKTPSILKKADFYAGRGIRIVSSCCSRNAVPGDENQMKLFDRDSFEYQQLRLNVLRALSFIDAHWEAQARMHAEFGDATGETEAAFRSVMAESRAEVEQAKEVLSSQNKRNLKHIISHNLCMILNNKTARYYNMLFESGVLMQRESRHFLEEIEHHLIDIRECHYDKHPGSVEFDDDNDLEVTLRHMSSRHLLMKQASRTSVMKLPSSRKLAQAPSDSSPPPKQRRSVITLRNSMLAQV